MGLTVDGDGPGRGVRYASGPSWRLPMTLLGVAVLLVTGVPPMPDAANVLSPLRGVVSDLQGVDDPGEERRISLEMVGCGTIDSGDSGECVTTLQTWLNLAGGYDLEVDGSFGSGTEAAVRDFQAEHGVDTTGAFGRKSRRALRVWWEETTEGVPLDDAPLFTDMGRYVVRAIVCQGTGTVSRWLTRSPATKVGAIVICNVLLSPAPDGEAGVT